MPSKTAKRDIENYEHKDKKRVNNPPVGLVTPKTRTRCEQEDLRLRSAP